MKNREEYEKKKTEFIMKYARKFRKHTNWSSALQHYINNYLWILLVSDKYKKKKYEAIVKEINKLLDDKKWKFKSYLKELYKSDSRVTHTNAIENYIKV